MRTRRGGRARRLALVLALAPGACAHPADRAALGPHLVAGIPADVPAGRPRLGVGRFVDARPRSDRIGRRPVLRVRWYGLVRRGERQTGDASFGADLEEGLRSDAAATLARSGAFSEVRLVEARDADASSVAAAQDLDFVLTMRIEELVGIQQEDLLVSFVPIRGFRNRLSDPIGMVRLRYRLHPVRGPLLEDQIETVHRGGGRSPSGAALDAAARANERIAERLFLRLVPEDARVRRSVPVRVVDRCGLGRERVELLVTDTSSALEREAGIRLAPDWVRASEDRFSDLEAALAASRDEAPPPGAFVLSLVRLEDGAREHRSGLSDPLGEHAVATCDTRGDVRVVTLAHEVGHLFGAVHVGDRGSVMHAVAEFDARFFDPLNRRILRAAWNRPFGAPLPHATRAELEALYRGALETEGGIDREEVGVLLAGLRS